MPVLSTARAEQSAPNAPPMAWYAVFVLMLMYIISFIDRQVISLFVGFSFFILMSSAPATMRAQLSAFYITVINLVGLAMGPTVVALFTDYVFRAEGLVHLSLAATAAVSMPLAIGLLLWGRKAIIETDKTLQGAITRSEGGARP
jgi:hypothetical protein